MLNQHCGGQQRFQLESLFPEIDRLHRLYGDPNLFPIYGAGCVNRPKLFLLLMNPTGKNLSAHRQWRGMRAPWVGTKNIWKFLFGLEVLDKDLFLLTQKLRPSEWTPEFVLEIYSGLDANGIYLTSLAKCTQADARPLSNDIFRQFLQQTGKEIELINPEKIVSFGNQVSSILLGKLIRVSNYHRRFEELKIGDKIFPVYPTYYPVGQGMRNMARAIEDVSNL